MFVGDSQLQESEGFDRPSIDLPASQVNLINAVAKANPRTVVILEAGAQIVMENWIDNVNALVEAWYPGQEELRRSPRSLEMHKSFGQTPRNYAEEMEMVLRTVHIRERMAKRDTATALSRSATAILIRKISASGIHSATGCCTDKSSITDTKITLVPMSSDEYTVTASIENTSDVAGAEVVEQV